MRAVDSKSEGVALAGRSFRAFISEAFGCRTHEKFNSLLTFEQVLAVSGVLGAIVSFVWSVWTWKETHAKELAQREIDAERVSRDRRLEATKPFLEQQLRLYTDAAKVAAGIATSDESTDDFQESVAKFWQLYFGELALVENTDVASAMVEMGKVIENPTKTQKHLRNAALRVVHACRGSLDRSWGIRAWSSPDDAAR